MDVIFGKVEKVDILAIGAHPDDIELGAGGTLIKHIKMGYRVGLVDATYGEMGTNGDKETRCEESIRAARFMGATFRINLNIGDGKISHYKYEHVLELIRVIRACRPNVILTTNEDRHPDHYATFLLTKEAAFMSGSPKITTEPIANEEQLPYRPEFIFRYIQFKDFIPSFVVDISDVISDKIELIKCYRSQFDERGEPTILNRVDMTDYVKARAMVMGMRSFTPFGEGFMFDFPLLIHDITSITRNNLIRSDGTKFASLRRGQ